MRPSHARPAGSSCEERRQARDRRLVLRPKPALQRGTALREVMVVALSAANRLGHLLRRVPAEERGLSESGPKLWQIREHERPAKPDRLEGGAIQDVGVDGGLGADV